MTPDKITAALEQFENGKVDECYNTIRTILEKLSTTHVMVPMEATQDMVSAGVSLRYSKNSLCKDIYKAMITAAQESE